MAYRTSFIRPGSEQAMPVAAALAVVAAAAWLALGAGIGHTTHDDVLGAGHPPEPAAIAALLGGWQVMVAAMMLPPEIASPNANAPHFRRPWWTDAAFTILTTCAVWTGFAIVALSGDAVVHHVAESRPQLAGLVAPAVLVGAGAFQLTALRRHLLVVASHSSASPWRRAICGLGSCCALMLVFFALGVGNLPAMAALTLVMTVEHAANEQLKRLIGSLVGWALIVAGALVAIQPGLIT
jgi:predicted metal-binding membrane protein